MKTYELLIVPMVSDYDITLDFSKHDRHRRIDSLDSDPTRVGMTFTIRIDKCHHLVGATEQHFHGTKSVEVFKAKGGWRRLDTKILIKGRQKCRGRTWYLRVAILPFANSETEDSPLPRNTFLSTI